jgi:succinate dehydrogenase/fumarate reductase cytochrome b subunit
MDLSNPGNLIIAAIYYGLVGLMTFFSAFGVYILIRYGRSRTVSTTISVIYIIFFLQVLEQSYRTLQNIR